MKRSEYAIGAALIGVASLFTGAASGAVVVDILEVGGNVEATYAGSINLDATLGFDFNGTFSSGFFVPNGGAYSNAVGAVDVYDTSSGGTPYGTGGSGNWDLVSGDPFLLFISADVGVPTGYVSNTFISGTSTEIGATFTSLGMTPGTYVTTFNNAGISDSVTINVIPEPTSLALLGLGTLTLLRRRRA